jgi:hypothetical protein
VNLSQTILAVAAVLIGFAAAFVVLVNSRPARLLAAVIAAVIVVPGSTALAAADNPVTAPLDSTGTLVVISAWWVTFLAGSVIPLATAVLTKITTPSSVKYAITVVLNAAAAYLTTELAEDGAKVISGQAFMTWLAGIAMSLVAYKGWKSVGMTSSLYKRQAMSSLVPGRLATVGIK